MKRIFDLITAAVALLLLCLPLAVLTLLVRRKLGHPAFFRQTRPGLLDADKLHWQHLLSHRQVTDSYLLGLAVRHQCRFVSFDVKLNLNAVPDAQPEHPLVL